MVALRVALLFLMAPFDQFTGHAGLHLERHCFATCISILGRLFILMNGGVTLLGEAGHAAAHAMHDDAPGLRIVGNTRLAISKTIIRFSVVALIAVEVIQPDCTRKLDA